eukprot:c23602_g1_i1 orf=188-1804(-)
MIPYLNLVVYVCVSFVTGFFTSSLHVSTWLLQGLHSYMYPETTPGQEHQEMRGGNGLKNTKWREVLSSKDGVNEHEREKNDSRVPGDSNAEDAKNNGIKVVLKKRERKRKEKNQDRFSWEEGSSQIYRLTLSRTHFMGRLYFAEYDEVVVYTMVGLANLLGHEGLSYISHYLHMTTDEHARKFDIIPFLMGLFAVYKILRLSAQVGWQSSISRVSELILSIAVGLIGFFLALFILSFASSFILDFGLDSLFSGASGLPSSSGISDSKQKTGFLIGSPTVARVIIATIAGLLVGILVTPAHRNVRSFWSGTDQLQWNIPMAKWSGVVRFLLHINVALPLFASIIWIKPMGELFVASETSQQSGMLLQGSAESKAVEVHLWGKLLIPAPSDDWAQDFGVSTSLFGKVQFWGLLVAGLLHLCLFRVNVQTYLNEAIYIWYEGLHRSKVMNLELTKAKLLLNSYFLCRAAVQFFMPGMLVALLLGMSRVWGDVPLAGLAETSPNLFFLRIVALFLAWWATFSWSILTCVTLALYRTGFLLAS